jgi:hypothetical protein
MATFEIVEGAPGNGKSLYTAAITEWLLYRNRKWYEATGIRRPIWSNLKFSEAFEQEWDGYIYYWSDSAQLCKLHDVDIIWDEIATELDARNFMNLSIEMKRFLSQYRKRGVDIYANTQDFSMIDARARLMISGVKSLYKLCGNRDISTTKPNPKYIWGVIIIRTVENYREVNIEKKIYDPFFSWLFISRSLVAIYDTRQDIPLGLPPPLHHDVRICDHPSHGDKPFTKVIHA